MNRAPDPLAGLVSSLASVLAQLAVARRVRPRVALLTGLIAGVGLPVALRVLPRRWITAGGRRSGWFGYALLGGRRGERDRDDATEPPPPLPDLRELVEVVPIGETAQTGAATLTLLSLERYADGFLVRGRLLWNEEEPPAGDGDWHVDHPVAVLAVDDRGTAYHGRNHGGGGGGASWRFDHAFSPAIDPAATELRLTVPALRWHRVSPPWAKRPAAEERTEPGPWSFAVPLPGLPAEGATDRG
jgi:hypothetical protein